MRQPAFMFFLENQGLSVYPSETYEDAAVRCALGAARDEATAERVGIEFEWSPDDVIDSSDFSDEQPPWALWECVARYNGRIVASLGGVDFGRDRDPWMDNYRRVVEAELAHEALQHGCPCCRQPLRVHA